MAGFGSICPSFTVGATGTTNTVPAAAAFVRFTATPAIETEPLNGEERCASCAPSFPIDALRSTSRIFIARFPESGRVRS